MPTYAIQIASMYSKIVKCALPAYTKSWLDRANKASSLTIGGHTLLVPHKRLIWQPSLSQPTMEAYVTLSRKSHPCPSKTHWHGCGTQCRALLVSYGILCNYGNFGWHILWTSLQILSWMNPSSQNLTFSCQQLVMKYCHGWLKFGCEIKSLLTVIATL